MVHVVARTLAITALLLWFLILALELWLYQLEQRLAKRNGANQLGRDRPGLSRALEPAHSASRKSA